MWPSPECRLAALDITLPDVVLPLANYVPFTRSGNILAISGQLPFVKGRMMVTGKLGADVSLVEGIASAHTCSVNILAWVRRATGGQLDAVRRVVRLGGFVACTADFTEHAQVMNGASDLMIEAFGEAGKHVRTAVGAPSLPLDAPVEVEALFEVA